MWYVRGPKLPTTVWVFEEGLFLRSYGRSRVARWGEIEDFETSSDTGRPLFWLTVTHDLSVTMSVGFAPDVGPLMEYIEIRLAATQFLRRLESIWGGRRQRFGAVSLDREGLHGPKFFVHWQEVRRVVSDSHRLYVGWTRDDDSPSIRYRHVSFPYVVMAIAPVMIEEHKRFAKVDA